VSRGSVVNKAEISAARLRTLIVRATSLCYLRSQGGGNHGQGAGHVGSEPHTGECWKKK
jgi:hypothetical protein